MARQTLLRTTDLRGAVRLAADGTAGVTSLVEAMHERIARVPGVGTGDGRTRGITGLVYKTIRSVTRLAGGAADALLALAEPPQADFEPSVRREAIVAALNGVLGDHLAASGNPLAIPMSLRREGRAMSLEARALEQAVPHANGKLLVLLHGLCMSDLQWRRDGHDHGASLARDLGFTPVYLHYNTGLHIADNGAAFARLMETLVEKWPRRIEHLVLLCHSMGGLVARSALDSAHRAGHRWPARLDDLVFLGTPHHGAPLEQAGHWADVLLSATPYAAPMARIGKVRSSGIKDLRSGLDSPLPTKVRSYAVAGSIGQKSTLKGRVLGDGLVPLGSALGLASDPARQLAFAKQRQWVGRGINHMALLSHADVYAQLRRWLG